MKVGVLGPRGTYADISARTQFSDSKIVYYPTITDVVEAVAHEKVEIGVIPLESLREGSVGEALDAIAWHDVKIQSEMVVPITHSLLGVPGAKIGQITQVLSHPQAIAQCREFLQKNLPKAELIEMSSTAKAAEQVSKLQQPHIAAICALATVEIYDYELEVLKDEIQKGEINLTRFVCVAKKDSKPTGHDKTSIVFSTAEDRPGILYEILGEFAARNINLTKIESRPSKKVLGDYLFFVDFEGHREDSRQREALETIKKKVAMLKVLGSYPKKF